MKSFCDENVTVSLSSPIGVLRISGCERGLHFVKRAGQKLPISQPDLNIECKLISSENENLPEAVQQCIQWLDSYFNMDKTTVTKQSGPVVNGHHPMICPKLGITEFAWKVYTKSASEVKFGSRQSYSGLAAIIKHPNASRAVGTALKNNPFSIVIPCHRITPKSGGVGFYGGGSGCSPLKEWLLNYEGSFLS